MASDKFTIVAMIIVEKTTMIWNVVDFAAWFV